MIDTQLCPAMLYQPQASNNTAIYDGCICQEYIIKKYQLSQAYLLTYDESDQ